MPKKYKISDSKQPTSKFIGTYCVLYVHLAFCLYFIANKNTVRQAKVV